MNLLFLQYETALGTAVNATPVFEAVKQAAPACRVTVAASGPAAEVLRHNPHIDRLVSTPSVYGHWVAAASRTFLLGLGETFDVCLTDSGNMRRRVVSLAFLSRARRRLGFTVAPRLYHEALEREMDRSVRDDNLRLLGLLGLPDTRPEPRVYFSAGENAAAETLLRRHGIGEAPLALFVARTSGGQPSEWFDDRFAAVADHLAEKHGAMVAFVGSAAQSAGIEAVRALMRQSSVSLAGATDILTLAALMCRADLVVTLDTGPMHMARAAGVPTVIIASAWQRAVEWLPLGVPHCLIVRRDDIPCRECYKTYCATHECMAEIDAQTVSRAVDLQWARHPPSAIERARRTGRNLSGRGVSHGGE